MKILRAQKFQPKKRDTKQQNTKLRKTDWDMIMQHDRSSRKLNFRCEAAVKDPESVKRLLEAGMIDPKGNITSEGSKKCDALSQKIAKPEPEGDEAPKVLETEKLNGLEEKKVDKMTASDWALLMKYDRMTGNLLKYDPETGELDQASRAILRDPSIIQRLIDHNMILPGGWLTPEAKLECDRIEKNPKKQAADDYTEQKISPNPGVPPDVNPERLLKDEHQSKDESESKDKPEAKADPEPERLSDKLSEIYAERKNDFETGNLSADKPETAADEVSQPHTIRQHYPDLKNQSALDLNKHKTMVYPDSKSHLEHTSNGERKSKDLGSDDLQAFFMNLPDPSSGSEPKGDSEHLSGDRQHIRLLPANLQRKDKEKANKPTKTAVIPLTGAVSGDTPRAVDLRAVPTPEDGDAEKSRRRKKDSGGGRGDSTEPPRFSLRDVFHIIFKRRLQILICFFFIVFMAITITVLMKPVYEASTQILVKLGRESVFVPTSGNVTPILNINREEQVNSEIEILKSRALAEKVVEKIGPTVLYKSLGEEKSGILNRFLTKYRREMTPDEIKADNFESAVAGFMKALNVTGVKKSNVIQVSFKHKDPKMAATVVNNLSDMYLDRHLAVHKTPQNAKFFKEQTDLLKDKLDQAEEKLKVLRKKHNITSLEEQRSLLLGQSSDLNSSLNQTISQEVETEKRIRQLRRQLEGVPQTISQGVETDQNPYLINTLEARLVELQLKEKELLTKYTDESRLVRNVKEEIRVVQQKLEEQENKSYGTRTSAVNPTYQRLKEELLRNEAEIEALKAKKITQKEHLDELQVKLENLNQVELELKQLKQEIEVDQENYRLYLSKVEESRISEAMDSEKIASVSLISPARPPRKPVSPKVLLNLLIGVFLAIFGSLTVALFREYLDDRIENIEDVETELNLPVLASVPVFEQKTAGAGKF